MAGQVGSIVMNEVANTAASFITNKIERLTDVSDKVERLEWKVLKIQSAVVESMRYDIKNEALLTMQKRLMDAAQEGEQVLQEFKYHVALSNSQSSDQAVTSSNLSIVRSSNSDEIQQPMNFHLVLTSLLRSISIIRPISQYMKNVLIRMKEREKLYRVLARIEVISEDICDFVEMSRLHHKKKREKRWRYRPYSVLLKLLCAELARDHVLMSFWEAQSSLMRFFEPEMAALIETKGDFGMKIGGANISEVPKMLVNVVGSWHVNVGVLV